MFGYIRWETRRSVGIGAERGLAGRGVEGVSAVLDAHGVGAESASALAAATAAVETAPTATPAESAASTSWQPSAVCLGQ